MFTKVFAPFAGAAAFVALFQASESILPPAIEGQGAYIGGPVASGETVGVAWQITKRTDCPGLTSRAWFGASGFQLTEPAQATALPVGTDMEYMIQTQIPALAPDGALELHIVGHFECPGKAPQSFDIGPVVFEVAS